MGNDFSSLSAVLYQSIYWVFTLFPATYPSILYSFICIEPTLSGIIHSNQSVLIIKHISIQMCKEYTHAHLTSPFGDVIDITIKKVNKKHYRYAQPFPSHSILI